MKLHEITTLKTIWQLIQIFGPNGRWAEDTLAGVIAVNRTPHLAGLVDGLGKYRQHKGKQNADDDNHHQHFHDGKCAVQFEAA